MKKLLLFVVLTLMSVVLKAQQDEFLVAFNKIPDTCNIVNTPEEVYTIYRDVKVSINVDSYKKYCNKEVLLVINTYYAPSTKSVSYIIRELTLEEIVDDLKRVIGTYEELKDVFYEQHQECQECISNMLDDINYRILWGEVFAKYFDL